MKNNKYVIYSTIVAALGGLLFGFDTAVISGTTSWLEKVYELSSFWLGFTVTSALIGTIIGAIIIGKPADKYGRRNTLFIVAVLYFISALGSAFAWDWYSFLFFRFIGGIGVGGASVVSPMYIAEISPAKYRGRLVAITQFNIVFGVLLAFFSNYIITELNLGAVEWRWMFGVEAVPAAIFFILLFKNPLSPRWLVANDRINEAKTVIEKCGSDSGNVEEEIEAIKVSLDFEHDSLHEPLLSKKYIKPIMLAIAIAMFNQLSGINAIMYYAPHIFKMAGAGSESAMLQTVLIGGINLILTMLALAVIDNFGRKKLMLVGSIGYILSLSSVAWAFYTYGTEFTETGSWIILISLLVFVASHAFGQGAVIWVFLSEIFPNKVRARGEALGTFTHWFMAAAISWTFPIIAEVSGGNTFAFYAVCMVGQLFWVIYVMPETKGVSLEQIQKKLGIK
ncbi:D-xylose proton-symporter XylE [hydrothermal vent metagenome]|uniref:D-xylose proton-symporter XylE n=1 Tax=hydrothermal vent metagenome TaxID=652676 RepID=A0A3B1CF57_9ZZZZ